MEEQQQEQQALQIAQQQNWQAIKAAVTTLAAEEGLNLLAHAVMGNPSGMAETAIFGGIAAFVAGYQGTKALRFLRGVIPHEELEPFQLLTRREHGKRSVMDKLLDRHPEAEGIDTEPLQNQDVSFEFDGEEDMPTPHSNSTLFLFSSVLDRFDPSIDRIFLCRTADGRDLYCHAKDLCHVALAGNTGGGKSSIMRMLMLQLCKARVRVLLLNPHYTGYDLENGEDWTPFEPYLAHPPMECRKYEVIEHYLRAAAKDLIPNRLERRANSQPVGKPYFIVIDELPSIVREIEEAPEYMRVILEEGRKVGVFLITAAQDFLVKTISPKAGGGSIRECYRTAYYVGGDPTTARTLLDLQKGDVIPEDQLGKGVVMFRGVPSKKSTQVFVPYVDNESLYKLLGKSTYKPSVMVEKPEQELPRPSVAVSEQPRPAMPSQHLQSLQVGPGGPYLRAVPTQTEMEDIPMRPSETRMLPEVELEMERRPVATMGRNASLSPELQEAYDAFRPGMSNSELGRALNVDKTTAGRRIQRLIDKGYVSIDKTRKLVG